MTLVVLYASSTYATLDAVTIKVVAPYLPENVENDGRSGRDIQIFTDITKCMGLKVKIDVQPYMRHLKSYLSDSHYDAIMTIPHTDTKVKNKTLNYISYNNGVIVRHEDFPHGLKRLEDLKGKSIISFIGGKKLLKGLEKNLNLFSSYTETGTQYRHNEMLMKKRVDGVFSDGLIFMAHQRRLIQREKEWSSVKVKFYSLFSLSHFSAAFRDPKKVPLFNGCLSKLKKNGHLAKIEKLYAMKYNESLGEEYLKPLLAK